ncbi:eukaryotic mitochondrial regulator protein-domain-containing protein [Trametes polyzona]|nr:eukaryotic mitochondrial regulator protein-domain-containing protein [Trametes polyzona]
MLAHLAQASRRPTRSWLASLAPRRHYAAGGPDSADPFKEGPTYAQWLRKEGVKYKEPHRPNNWLGGEVPFPLNPTFKPPPPVSDAMRTEIWSWHMRDPVKFDVRFLSQHFGLSIARVDAILRLKGLEEHWRKNKQLQTGFLHGMEYILGITDRAESAGLRKAAQELSEDAVEADAVSESTKALARDRYQRLFWEPTKEGQSPTLPTALARAAEDAVKLSARREAAKLKRLRGISTETEPELVLQRQGRPTMRFVDVGVKFLDVDDRLKRVNAAKRRAVMKRRRRGSAGVAGHGQQSDAGAAPSASV